LYKYTNKGNIIKTNKNITILYVEDEKGIRESLQKALKYFCDTLYVASDGMEGLVLYKEYAPDIVITDIRMPKMNGIEMAKKIMEINDRQHLIFTTAHSESDYFIEAINMQADGYILKPIDLDKLEHRIEDILEIINLKLDYKKQQIQLIKSEKRASMGELIGNIAHQWRQPLSVIATTASSMQLKKGLDNLSDDDFNKSCEMIDEKAQYLSKTIDNFRNYIMEETIKRDFNVQELLLETINIIEAELKNYNIILIKDINPNIDSTNYSNLLKQVLLNIFNNAKDALAESKEKTKYIFLKLIDSDDTYTISIQDNAGGIPEDIINKIYEPYFTTKHQASGTGLGLYIAFDMVTNDLNGSLKEENITFVHEEIEYIGAKFNITLPK